MNFDHAWTFAGQPRDETPAPPPGKRTPVLPRPPACRALVRQGKRILRAMLAVFRTGRRQHLAFGEHVLGPGVPHLAAQPKRHGRRLSHPPPSHKACLGNIGQRLSHGAGRIGPPHPNRLVSACRGLRKLVRISRTAGCDPKRNLSLRPRLEGDRHKSEARPAGRFTSRVISLADRGRHAGNAAGIIRDRC